MEVASTLTSNGDNIGIWSDTGHSCQEWSLVDAGMQGADITI
jgi:hypothetical protein